MATLSRDDVGELAQLINFNVDDVTSKKCEVLIGDDAGAGEKEAAFGEEVLPA